MCAAKGGWMNIHSCINYCPTSLLKKIEKYLKSHLVWNCIRFFSLRHHSMCPGDYEVNWNNNNTCMGLLKLDNASKNRWNIL